MIIPISSIEPDTLYRIAEEFVTREGTDYGDSEMELSVKVKELLTSLKKGNVVVVFDQTLESVNLMLKQDYDQLNSES